AACGGGSYPGRRRCWIGSRMSMSAAPLESEQIGALTPLDERSRDLRRTIVRVLEAGRRGHVGSAFSLVEILRVLYDDVLRYDPQNSRWPGRDRCLLSK